MAQCLVDTEGQRRCRNISVSGYFMCKYHRSIPASEAGDVLAWQLHGFSYNGHHVHIDRNNKIHAGSEGVGWEHLAPMPRIRYRKCLAGDKDVGRCEEAATPGFYLCDHHRALVAGEPQYNIHPVFQSANERGKLIYVDGLNRFWYKVSGGWLQHEEQFRRTVDVLRLSDGYIFLIGGGSGQVESERESEHFRRFVGRSKA